MENWITKETSNFLPGTLRGYETIWSAVQHGWKHQWSDQLAHHHSSYNRWSNSVLAAEKMLHLRCKKLLVLKITAFLLSFPGAVTASFSCIRASPGSVSTGTTSPPAGSIFQILWSSTLNVLDAVQLYEFLPLTEQMSVGNCHIFALSCRLQWQRRAWLMLLQNHKFDL